MRRIAAALAAAPLSLATPAATLGVVLAAAPALAQQAAAPPTDHDNIITISGENDAVSTYRGTSDQYYTSGLRLGWTSGQDDFDWAHQAGQYVWGAGTTRISFELVQSLFTPHNTQLNPPDPRDRPYAGELVATGALIHDTADARDIAAISLGIVGPSALGEQLQNGFHGLIGDTKNQGWSHQIGDQPAFEGLLQRTRRVALIDVGPLQTDVLPSLAVGLGDVRDYIQLGSVVRIGQGLDSDFGPSRITPGITGSDAYTNTRDFAWYAFAGVDAQAVGYDVTLDGSSFRSHSPSVSKRWDVGEAEGGVALLYAGLRLTYTQTWQTPEFKRQRSGLFNFGSLTLSAKF